MINHIDLGMVLRSTVSDLYTDLVTRPTGAAVRNGIEQQLAEVGDRTVTVIDFSHVGLLDYSCADEVVAKLLMRYCAPPGATAPPRDAYFIFRGASESHLDAIEAVLERHGLAIVAQTDEGDVVLIGSVGDRERRTWEVMRRLGRAAPMELARELELDLTQVVESLDALWRQRLAIRLGGHYVAVGALK